MKQKDFNGMLHDPNSKPLVGWANVKCSVKRRDMTYTAALAESKMMSDMSDTSENTTDSEIMPPPLTTAKRKVMFRSTIGRPVVRDFTSMVNTKYLLLI